MEKNDFLLKLDLQHFAEDGEGSSYEPIPDQLPNLYTDENEPEETFVESDETDEVEEFEESEFEENEEEVVETALSTFDLGELGKASLEDIRNWKNGHLMHQDYTQKTQTLAREKEEFYQNQLTIQQQMREQLQNELQTQYQPYQRLEQMLQQNPQFREQFTQFMNQAPVNPFPNPQVEQMKTQYESQITQLQQQMEDFRRQEMVRQAQSEWNNLASTYPDAKDMMQQIIELADEKKVDLETAYQKLTYGQIKQKTQEEVVKTQMRKKQVHQNGMGKQTGAKEKSFDPTKASMSDISRYVASNFKFIE